MKILNALVIGAGRIGSQFDSHDDARILTHAKAYMRHPQTALKALVEVDPVKGAEEAAKWGIPVYQTLDEAFAEHDIDLVSICVPDTHHFFYLKQLSEKSIKGILCEKPLTATEEESRQVAALLEGRCVCVNYTRRFVPEIDAIRQAIGQGQYGKFLSGTATYGKGILHNGTHMLDLLNSLLGPINSVKWVNEMVDFAQQDPTVSGFLSFEQGTVFLQGIDARLVTVFECDLLFEKGRMRLDELGYRLTTFANLPSPYFAGYRNYVEQTTIQTGMAVAMYQAVDHLVTCVNEQKEPISNINTALNASQMAYELIAQGRYQ